MEDLRENSSTNGKRSTEYLAWHSDWLQQLVAESYSAETNAGWQGNTSMLREYLENSNRLSGHQR